MAIGLFGEPVVDEIVELRRRGFRFVARADDNFYPVTSVDLAIAERQRHVARLEQLRALRAERFELMDRLARLPSDMVSCGTAARDAAVLGLLPAMLLFALFTEGPSPRHEEVLHRVEVTP